MTKHTDLIKRLRQSATISRIFADDRAELENEAADALEASERKPLMEEQIGVTVAPIRMNVKVRCEERHCGWHGLTSETLTAVNPFDPQEEITGCPECKGINTLFNACDEPGCWKLVTGGYPTPTGYRTTCHAHIPKEQT